MKALLIVASLIVNVLLALMVAARSPSAPPAFRDFFSQHRPAAAAAPAKADAPRSTAKGKSPLWSTLASDDPATLVARLRAAGFPASLIRAIVTSEMSSRYNARMRALTSPDPNAPFWKSTNNSVLNAARTDELMKIQQDYSRQLRDLFKDEFFANGDVSAAQRRQYGNLPPAKIEQLQRIEDDYAELGRTLSSAMRGVTLPEDREKLAVLNREKNADLAAVLSPEEFAEYTMRSSQITRMLASQFGGFNPTESEFRAIFQMQQTLNDQFPMTITGGSISPSNDEQRRAAQQQLEQQLKASFGEARYAEYMRETDREFIQLNQLVQRDNLPATAALQAFNLRETVAQESNRIFDDPSLDMAQKRLALQTLAQNARAQLLASLGPVSGPGYVKLADQWLGNVERGGAVSFVTGFGGMSIFSSNNGGIATAVYTGGTTPSYRRLASPNPPAPPR